jgi:hypothetical protein
MNVYINAYMCVYVHMHMNLYMYLYKYVYTYIYVYAYKYMYTHVTIFYRNNFAIFFLISQSIDIIFYHFDTKQ